MEAEHRPAVVMDCGSGFTKLGFAGNTSPTFTFPTALATTDDNSARRQNDILSDLAYSFGDSAVAQVSTSKSVHYPIRFGLVDDWDQTERMWQHCIQHCMRVNPEDHYFVLTEPPLNTPENREQTAEIMFETFKVPGLHIGMQATLALYATMRGADAGKKLTGTVVDVGDGCTHVMPVVDGYVLAACMKTMPLAGRDVTRFIQQLLRKKGAPVPPDMSLEVARAVKEELGYTCGGMAAEGGKHVADPAKYRRQYSGYHPGTGKPFTVEVSEERFLGPEIFFSPHIYTSAPVTPLPQLLGEVIQSCPIDTRRDLYSNIVLSGGTTMFRDFGTRLVRDLAALAAPRMSKASTPLQVVLNKNSRKHYAVWLGGSVLANSPAFHSVCRTRQQYEEYGPGICRANDVFKDAV